MTIAVTGATGQLGRLVIEALKTKVPASEIVALARSPEKAADLGVSARAADYTAPEALEQALQGVETLLLISSNEIGQRAVQHANVIAAAKAAGVGRIVYTSLLHADRSPLSLAGEHRETEAALKSSGLAHSILRNGWYAENHLGSIPAALAGGAFLGSAGEGRISAATREDFAEAAAVVLTGEGHEGKTYELAGDEGFTLADLAAELSRQTGRDIPYRNLPEAEYAAILQGAGLPAPLAEAIAGWDGDAAQGALQEDGRALSRLIGRPTTPLREAVAAALAG
ncbi:SDR family oxidoreductase [Paracoccus zhejiangensis]|uniref:NAD(P)-dependent oxidoreductase n=1 Tax=Paracoccus zhejiangensis TaxID=1077935 RepID=A0A2H5F2K0_9RHOB|nr:SDR family oxidoreductase [Paracoccus zhejiangensis]AUH65773.1 NAD(P)-dependent oxidoreductase [Paracoccus zhejiangensis]